MTINVEERETLAKDYFKQGYNCSQAVVLAFQDILGLDFKTLEKLSIGFGGGVGRLREVCGAMNAIAFISGSICNLEGKNVQQQKTEAYSLVQNFAARFRQENGFIVCRDLLGAQAGQTPDPHPQERTQEYYKGRPCADIVGSAARMVAEYLQTI